MKKEGVKFYKFPDDMITARRYADESWGDLADLLKDKYGFTIDDICTNDERQPGLSEFAHSIFDFCFVLAQRRLEVERRNSGQPPEEPMTFSDFHADLSDIILRAENDPDMSEDELGKIRKFASTASKMATELENVLKGNRSTEGG